MLHIVTGRDLSTFSLHLSAHLSILLPLTCCFHVRAQTRAAVSALARQSRLLFVILRQFVSWQRLRVSTVIKRRAFLPFLHVSPVMNRRQVHQLMSGVTLESVTPRACRPAEFVGQSVSLCTTIRTDSTDIRQFDCKWTSDSLSQFSLGRSTQNTLSEYRLHFHPNKG